MWGELHSRGALAPPLPHHPPHHHPPQRPPASPWQIPHRHPPPAAARRKQGRRSFDLRQLLGNLFPQRVRPRGEARSSQFLVKPYRGKPLPRPPGRPPSRGGERRLQSGNLVERLPKVVESLPKGALAQAISLGVVAAVLAV